MPDPPAQEPQRRRQTVDITAMRAAPAHALDPETVESHLLPDREADELCARAWRDGLSSLPLNERRGRLPGATGHIAESVVETIRVSLGYIPLWHFASGGHGVDLLLVTPEFDAVLTVEVKETLRLGRWPRLRRADLDQTPAWLEESDNPGMKEWNLASADVIGGVLLVNFADQLVKAGVTGDFRTVRPVERLEDLVDLSWLETLTGPRV